MLSNGGCGAEVHPSCGGTSNAPGLSVRPRLEVDNVTGINRTARLLGSWHFPARENRLPSYLLQRGHGGRADASRGGQTKVPSSLPGNVTFAINQDGSDYKRPSPAQPSAKLRAFEKDVVKTSLNLALSPVPAWLWANAPETELISLWSLDITQVRKTPSRPRNWADCSLSSLHFHGNVRASSQRLG